MSARGLTLEAIISDDLFAGTSLILGQKDRFLYGIRPPVLVRGRTILEVTGIGGGREESDSSPAAGVIREAQEEIACDIRLVVSSETLIVRSQSSVERVVLEGSERPTAIVFRNYRTPPHQPWHEDNHGRACLIVFAAALLGEPRPAMELPYLIWLTPTQILQTAQEDVRLYDLLNAGAELIGEAASLTTLDGWVRLTDSQEALALALGEDTFAFYRSVGRG